MTNTALASLNELKSAFPAVDLSPEHAFGEGGTTYLDGENFIEGVRGHTWQSLAPAFLEHHHDGLLFFTPGAFGDYIPAFVAAVAKGGPEIRNLPAFLRGALTRSRDPQWFDARVSRLSGEQQSAIANVLIALEDQTESTLNKQDLTEVIDSYWRDVARRAKP